jgi:alcohol dehydrogenase class IV
MFEDAWWSFTTAGRVSFGSGVSRFVSTAVSQLGNRIVLCTDQNLIQAGLVEPVVDAIRGIPGVDVLIFDGGVPEIGFDGVERCFEVVRGFSPNVVVGLGGGSNLDLAKVIAARCVDDRDVRSWITDGVPKDALPIVALPTTAGTGSEVTSVAVLTNEESQTKVGFQSPVLMPKVALVDPLLTLSCPPKVTAYSGMDALTHAVESFTAIDFADKAVPGYLDQGFIGRNPVSNALAMSAIVLIGENLERAVTQGDDVPAREAMALGSLLAGMAFATAGTSIVHALQYPLGALTKTAHGLGNAVLLPSAIRFNLNSRTREAAEIARALGDRGHNDQVAAARLPDLVGDLAWSVGIEPNLRSLGVSESDLDQIAEAASRITRLTGNNPRPVEIAGLREVLYGALDYRPPTMRVAI